MTWTVFQNAFNPVIILTVRWCRLTVSVEVYEVMFKSVIQQSCYVVSKAISSIQRRLICSDSSVYKNKYVNWWDGSTPCSQSRCEGKQVVHGACEFQVWFVFAHVQLLEHRRLIARFTRVYHGSYAEPDESRSYPLASFCKDTFDYYSVSYTSGL
jgi:hypothetical protein